MADIKKQTYLTNVRVFPFDKLQDNFSETVFSEFTVPKNHIKTQSTAGKGF